MRNARLDSKGFSLFEVLLSTSVFLLLYISSMAVFQSAKKQNAIQRTEMETQTAAALSLDKIQMEASRAGLGLIQAIDQGLLNGIGTDGGGKNSVDECGHFLSKAETDVDRRKHIR